MILAIAVCAAAILCDQLSKAWIVANMEQGASRAAIPGLFRLTYIENRGMAFGLLANHRWVFLLFSVIALGAILFFLWKEKPKNRWICLSLGMILGGGIGNMIDRTLRGAVIDFIDVEFMQFYVFNVADMFVCVGGGLLCLCLIVSELRMAQEKKKPKPTLPENGEDEA